MGILNRYSLEEAQAEAEKVQSLIASGRARNETEAETTLHLSDRPQNILQRFVAEPLPKPLPKSEAWRRNFQEKVRDCLQGKPQISYVRGLLLTSTQPREADSEKLRLLAAAWIHALENPDYFPEIHRNNKLGFGRTYLMHNAMRLSTREDLLGKTLKDYFSHHRLQDLLEIERIPPTALTSRAVEKMELGSEVAVAEEIFKRGMDTFFINDFVQDVSAIEAGLTYFQENHPQEYKRFCLKLGNIYGSRRPDSIRPSIRKSPTFQEAISEGIAILAETNEAMRQKRERDNAKADSIIASCTTPEIKMIAFCPTWEEWAQNMDKSNASPLSIDKENTQILFGRNSIWHMDVFRSWVDHLWLSSERREALRKIWDLVEEKIKLSVTETIDRAKPALLRGAMSYCQPDNSELKGGNLEAYKAKIEIVLANIERARKPMPYPAFQSFLDEVSGLISERLTEIPLEYKRRQQEALRMQTEEIERIKKEYVRDTVEGQITYLQQIYGACTGLDLDIPAHAASDIGGASGMVQMGGSSGPTLQLRQNVTLSLKLQLKRRDHMDLEIGDSLEEFEEKRKMADWVIPHEIAHVVDWKLKGVCAKRVSQHRHEIDRIGAAAISRDEAKEKLIRDGLKYTAKECLIDGLGYRMVRAYGTTDLFDTTEPARITKAIEGFLATTGIFQKTVASQIADEDMQSSGPFILLRMIAVAKILTQAVQEHHLSDKLIFQLNTTGADLEALYKSLNDKQLGLNAKQKRYILSFFRALFLEAREISINP